MRIRKITSKIIAIALCFMLVLVMGIYQKSDAAKMEAEVLPVIVLNNLSDIGQATLPIEIYQLKMFEVSGLKISDNLDVSELFEFSSLYENADRQVRAYVSNQPYIEKFEENPTTILFDNVEFIYIGDICESNSNNSILRL